MPKYYFLFLSILFIACTPKQEGPNFLDKYESWKAAKIATGEYCAETNCDPKLVAAKVKRGEKYCMVGLADTISFTTGDINQDGILDAYSNVPMQQCDGGNALMFGNILLLFISTKDGGHQTLEEPEGLRKGIGYLTGINEKGHIEVTSQDYAAEDPRCCPSIERKQFFKYKDGKFKVVK